MPCHAMNPNFPYPTMILYNPCCATSPNADSRLPNSPRHNATSRPGSTLPYVTDDYLITAH